MTAGELVAVLAPILIAVGGGGWKIGGGLVAMARTVDKIGVELKSMNTRLERVEETINSIAPPTVQVSPPTP